MQALEPVHGWSSLTHNACPCRSFRLLHGSAGWLPGAEILRHIESTTTVETGRMRAARAMPVGRPATKAARALSSERRPPAEPLLGNRKARAPTEPAARPPSLGSASPAVAAPAGSGDPAQLPWASRSRASRCPSGGRSEICVPCGWQHSPSSEACSCQVRPSQHQPWLVSTCSVTAHLSHRFCHPSASTQRRATHTSPAARAGPRSTTTTAGLAPSVVGRDFLQLTRGWN
jgi:hypothetical protein